MRWLAIFLAAMAFGLGAPEAHAEHERGRDRMLAEHERARDRMLGGTIRPLGEVLTRVRSQFAGRLLDARLVKVGRGNRWVYDIKLLTPEGRVLVLTVDARTTNILRVR